MADTVRTRSNLITLFADNTSGAITAQDMRDFIISTTVPILATAGENLVLGNIVYPKESDGRYWKAEGNASTTMPCVAIVADTTINTGNTGALLNVGYITVGTWSWTPNKLLYVSDTTSGAMTHTIPTTSGSLVQIVGYAISATQIFFNPSLACITLM